MNTNDCEHFYVTGTWQNGNETARRCDDCGQELDEDGDEINPLDCADDPVFFREDGSVR
jgi:hypothetical protein